MPIYLDKIADVTDNLPKLTPRFFSTKLTGNGGKAGLLNERITVNRPAYKALPSYCTNLAPDSTIWYQQHHKLADLQIWQIPLTMLLPATLDDVLTHPGGGKYLSTLRQLDLTQKQFAITCEIWDNNTPKNIDITISLEPVVALVINQENFINPNQMVTKHNEVSIIWRSVVIYDTSFDVSYSFTPKEHIIDILHSINFTKSNARDQVIQDFSTWLDNFDVAEAVVGQAELWTSNRIGEIAATHIQNLHLTANSHNDSPVVMNNLAFWLRYLETYKVSLEAYALIYDALQRTPLSKDTRGKLVKQNLNLLTNSTLHELRDIKPQLPSTPNLVAQVVNLHLVPPINSPQPPVSHLAGNPLSSQQRAAVEAIGPLTLVQAGAGTGKSHCVLNRIDALITSGITPANILVLSFTNAAADHIAELKPGIGSMTIASMIHEIYQLNHPTHQLSNIDTLLNMIEMMYPTDQVAVNLHRYLFAILRNQPGALMALCTYIENRQPQVIKLLNSIGQTTLELEQIIVYLGMAHYRIPNTLLAKHIFVDECQDSSVFEQVFFLNWAKIHHTSLFLVGDCSQTLYEFRAANPQTLNAIESSGVFDIYQLTTNYRSNQDILDFANQTLATIEANRYANIRLQANSLETTTAKQFQERVGMQYLQYSSTKALLEDLPHYVESMYDWIADRIYNDEQVLFLSYSRANAEVFKQSLENLFPAETVTSLISDRMQPNTLFSAFIKDHWDIVTQANPTQAAFTFTSELLNSISRSKNNRRISDAKLHVLEDTARGMVSDWWLKNHTHIQALVNLTMMVPGNNLVPTMSRIEFFEQLKNSLIDYEVEYNSLKSALTSARNNQRKEEIDPDTKLFTSTIHGVKGLEFDNVVVLHQDNGYHLDDADRRMYYVAFTRAKNSLKVLSYGKNREGQLAYDWQQIVDRKLAAEQPSTKTLQPPPIELAA